MNGSTVLPGGRTLLMLVAGTAALWVAVGVMMGMQATLGAALQGGDTALGPAVRAAFVQTLPWIPVTLLVGALAVAFPLVPPEPRWRRNLAVHVAAVPVVAFLANAGVVLGFWAMSGGWQSLDALLRAAAYWGVLRIHVAAVLYLAIAALVQGALYARRLRARELTLARREGQLAVARLQALTAQIRPHFLFNTLHTIGQLWRAGRGEDGDAMLDHLGGLFQRVQSTTDHLRVSLDEELDMVEDYLAIERVRFGSRLQAEVSASAEARSAAVPPLILQPIVENAIRHGVGPRAGPGTLRVSARVEGDDLVLQVVDDGPGFDAPGVDASGVASAGSDRPGSGTGLSNVEARLAELYRGGARLERGRGPGGGASVRMVLPLEAAP